MQRTTPQSPTHTNKRTIENSMHNDMVESRKLGVVDEEIVDEGEEDRVFAVSKIRIPEVWQICNTCSVSDDKNSHSSLDRARSAGILLLTLPKRCKQTKSHHTHNSNKTHHAHKNSWPLELRGNY